jgi:hypothetical protein
MRVDDLNVGKRPRSKFLFQYEAIVSGEFTVANKEHLKLGKGSHVDVDLLRTSDGHPFKMRCDLFCAGQRPPDSFLYQYDAIKNGEFTVVHKDHLQLGQGSHVDVDFVRNADNYPFTMRCDHFCSGQPPRAFFLYQFKPIVLGQFKVSNEKDSKLTGGANKQIEFERASTGEKFPMRIDQFCSRLCFQCLGFSHCTYEANLCASCWCIKNPGSALSFAANEGNKTEILVSALMQAHFGDVRREYETRDKKREDVVLLSKMLVVAVDGAHHFFNTSYPGDYGRLTFCDDIQKMDVQKIKWWFEDHRGSTYVRMEQRDTWRGYPVSQDKPINFDFVNALHFIMNRPLLYADTVVFLEISERPHYDPHRRLLDAAGIKHATLDPRKIEFTGGSDTKITEDKRHIFI